MAIVTKTIAVLPWDETTTALLQIDYDDVSLRVTAVRVINPAPRGLIVTAGRTDGRRTYTATAPGADDAHPTGQTTTVTVPTGAAQRLQLVVDERGRLDGIEYSTQWAAA